MKIEDKLKNIDNWLCGAYDDFVDVKKYINRLEADKLEAYEAIDSMVHNSCCRSYSMSFEHSKDCIVEKAREYLGERSERD